MKQIYKMEVLERKIRSKSVGCTPSNQEPLAEIVTHTKDKYAAIHANIKRMSENKDLSLREVMAQIQIFLATWTREELLTLVNLKVDQEIMDKYNIVITQKELKGCRQIIRALKRDNRELKRVIASCEYAFAELNSEEVHICPRTRINLTSKPQNSSNNGYEIAITKKFPKMRELDQFNLFVEPHQTLDKSDTSNLFTLERLIKQLEGCVAKRKQVQSSTKLKRRLIQECFQRFPQISLSEKNNTCHLWSAKKVIANKPVKVALQGTTPVVKAGNERILNEVGDLQDHFTNSGRIHPLGDVTPAGLNSQEMERGEIVDSFKSEDISNAGKNTPTDVKTPIINPVKYRKRRNIYPLRKKLDAKIKNIEKTKPTKLTVGINDALPPQEVLLKVESQSDSSQQKPTATNLPFPDFLKSQDCLSGGTSYYKKIQRIIGPRCKTTNIGSRSILLPNKAAGLENLDLAKQSSILNNLLRLNSDAALRALNEHHPIDKIDYRSVVDDSSDTRVSQTPAEISIKSEYPSPTGDAHNITPNVRNAPSKSTDVVNCCEQITLSTKPSRYHEADMSPLLKESNIAPAFKNATKNLNNASEKDASWAPVQIYHEKKNRTLKETGPVGVSPIYQNYTRFYYDKNRTTPRSRVNIVKVVDKDHPYSSRLINVHLQPIPMEVDLASNRDDCHEDATNRQPAPSLNHLDPFVQSSATILPQLGSTQMDTVDKKHKADDSTLGLGVNGLPIKKIKLSFKPLQTPQNFVKIADDSLNLKVETPIKCYSRTSSPKRNDASMSQLLTVVPQNTMDMDKPNCLTEIGGSKVDTTALQAKTALSQGGDNMPQIVSVTSQAAAVIGTEEPKTNSGNDSAKAGPSIKAPQWFDQLFKNATPKQVKVIATPTQAELNVSQTQVEMETITPQTQRVPPNSPQSQMVPPDSPQSQIEPPNSSQSQMVPTNTPQTQVVPPDSQPKQIAPLNSEPSQMVPSDSQKSQMVPTNMPQTQTVPPDSSQSQIVPTNTPQTQVVPPDSPQSQMEPPDSQPKQIAPPDSQPSQMIPPDSQQTQIAPPDSQPSQMIPPDSQQTQIAPPDSQPSQMIPPDSQQTQIAPPDSQPSQMIPPDSQQTQIALPDSQPSQMVPPDSQITQLVPTNMPQTQIVPLESQ